MFCSTSAGDHTHPYSLGHHSFGEIEPLTWGKALMRDREIHTARVADGWVCGYPGKSHGGRDCAPSSKCINGRIMYLHVGICWPNLRRND